MARRVLGEGGMSATLTVDPITPDWTRIAFTSGWSIDVRTAPFKAFWTVTHGQDVVLEMSDLPDRPLRVTHGALSRIPADVRSHLPSGVGVAPMPTPIPEWTH